MQSFLKLYGLRNLISEPACYKIPKKFSSIDLILTNCSSSSFHNSCAIETRLFDFHKMNITAMKTTFQKLKPKLIYCRDFFLMINVGKNFCPNYLWKILVTQETIWNIFYRFAPQKKNTIEIICLLGINLLLGYILE